MALPTRLLGRLAGGRRLPPPLAVLSHLAAAAQSPSHHRSPTPSPPPPPYPRVLPFSVPARSFSWYSRSRSGSGSSPAAAEATDEGAHVESESVWSDDVGSAADYGEGLAGAAGFAADAVGVGVAAGGDGGGVWGLAASPVVDLIDGLHGLTGLPWWITISLSTVAMRLSLLPILTLQIKKTAKIAQLVPKLPLPMPPWMVGKSLRDQYTLFRKKRRELGCPSFLWNLAYFSVQFPCFILWMASVRNMCLSNHPGFDNGGILWFHNLTEFSHGAFGPIFPILIAGIHYLNIQISFQGSQIIHQPGIIGLLAKYYKLYLDILAIPLFLVAYVVPQGSLVYWTTNSLLNVAQQLSLRNDAVQKMLGLPKIKAQPGNTAQKSPIDDKMMLRWTLKDASENTTPNFMFESNNKMEGNLSETSSPEELLEQALQYLGSGHRDQAVPLIKIAIEKKPDLFTALIAIGQTLFSNKLFPEATECFEHAIPKIEEQDPLLVLAYFGAGLSRIQQGDNKVAVELLQRLAELKEPEMPINKTCYFQGLVLLASVLSNEGRQSEAASYLERAVAYDPAIERLLKECKDSPED